MASPIVVQGTAVSPPRPTTQPQPYITDPNGAHHGEKQSTRCNDPIFALLFYGCVGAIAAVAAIKGPTALSADTNNSKKDYMPFVIYVIIVAVLSFFVSGGGLAVMMCIPETMIKVSLIFVTILSGVWMVLTFISGNIGLGVLGVIFFAISICYAWAVWSRIPFASINLVTALTAVKANFGVVFYAYVITLLAAVFSLVWSIAFVGVFDSTYTCTSNETCTQPNYGYLFLLFVAFFFPQQVFQYSIHTIVSGVVGTFWFEGPDETACCGSAVNGSFCRTMTTSFGSICFGGLVVAIIQALRMLANTAQANGDGNFCVCIAECLLACLASIIEYLNKWAFVYVGIYGFNYLTAAKNVFTLFKNRGWEAIIADDLVANTLFLVSVVVGAIIGAIGIVIQIASNLFAEIDTNDTDVKVYVFVLGFFVGLVICSILMSVVGSGVNAVIVLFAEAPAEFQQHYPELSQRMRTIWNEIYPGSV